MPNTICGRNNLRRTITAQEDLKHAILNRYHELFPYHAPAEEFACNLIDTLYFEWSDERISSRVREELQSLEFHTARAFAATLLDDARRLHAHWLQWVPEEFVRDDGGEEGKTVPGSGKSKHPLPRTDKLLRPLPDKSSKEVSGDQGGSKGDAALTEDRPQQSPHPSISQVAAEATATAASVAAPPPSGSIPAEVSASAAIPPPAEESASAAIQPQAEESASTASTSTHQAQPPPRSRLVDLPSELRTLIWTFALTAPYHPNTSTPPFPRTRSVPALLVPHFSHPPPLARVSRQVRRETLALFFAVNTFVFHITYSDPANHDGEEEGWYEWGMPEEALGWVQWVEGLRPDLPPPSTRSSPSPKEDGNDGNDGDYGSPGGKGSCITALSRVVLAAQRTHHPLAPSAARDQLEGQIFADLDSYGVSGLRERVHDEVAAGFKLRPLTGLARWVMFGGGRDMKIGDPGWDGRMLRGVVEGDHEDDENENGGKEEEGEVVGERSKRRRRVERKTEVLKLLLARGKAYARDFR